MNNCVKSATRWVTFTDIHPLLQLNWMTKDWVVKKKKIDIKCLAKCLVFLKNSNRIKPCFKMFCFVNRWILMTSFGIPPKIKWAIIVYDLAYCSVVYTHVFGQMGAIFFTGMVKTPWGRWTSLCLRQMILRSILSAWEEKHINVVLVISWFDRHCWPSDTVPYYIPLKFTLFVGG